MLRKVFLSLVMLTAIVIGSSAQTSPVSFSTKEKRTANDEIEISFTAAIENGWHVFPTNLPSGGPIPTTLTIEQCDGAQAIGSLHSKGQEKEEYSDVFGMKLRFFERTATFSQRFRITGSSYRIKGYLRYASCNATMCMPPRNVEFEAKGEGQKQAKATSPTSKEAVLPTSPEGEKHIGGSFENTDAGKDKRIDNGEDSDNKDSVYSSHTDSIGSSSNSNFSSPSGEIGRGTSTGALPLFLLGLAGGLLALCTPCVWPIIPMTVSFFLKRSKNRRRSIRDAIGYGLSIIAIFLSLGIAVSLMGHGNWLNGLATNSVFNILLCLLMIVFALSFFGWFEIRLPSSWADKVDSKASNTTGWISIFLMALTLVLVSFSCTAPIVGLLLVEASTSGIQSGALLGMLGFALALALPFTLFALFPSWLQGLPKSGSWMNIIKVSLGFIELAFACKFFSVADMAYGWHLMDREIFLALWIVIFLSLGLYLMGLLHFQSDGDDSKAKPVPAIILGMCSLAFALYMVPGLWGAPCKAVAAFAPPMSTQDFNLSTSHVSAAYTDYDQGMAAARSQGKPVLLDFTGYGCVNCRKMEAAVWTDPTVAQLLNDDYILISLFVDDKTPLPQHLQVKNADGTPRTLRTIGDKWSYFQESRFGYLAQPFYIAIGPDGKPLTGSYGYNEKSSDFIEFLRKGLDKFNSTRP